VRRAASHRARVAAVAVAVASGACGGPAPPKPAPPPVSAPLVVVAPPPDAGTAIADAAPPEDAAPPPRPAPEVIYVDPGGDPLFAYERTEAASVSTRDVVRLYGDRTVCFHEVRSSSALRLHFASGSSRITSPDALAGGRSIEAILRGGPGGIVLHAFADPAETATEDEGKRLAEARGNAANQVLAKAGVRLALPVVVHGWAARIDDDERSRAFNRRLELGSAGGAPSSSSRMWRAPPVKLETAAAFAASAEGARASAVASRGARAARSCIRPRGAKPVCFDATKSGDALAAIDALFQRTIAAECALDLDAR